MSLEQDLAALSAEDREILLMNATSELAICKLRRIRDWQPRGYQQALWDYLQHGGKRAIAVWHRRSGKDAVALNWAAETLVKRPVEIWHMLPEAAQARKAVWMAVDPHTGIRRIDQAFPLELRENTRDQDMTISFKNGSLFCVVGSDNYNSLIGSTPYGVVFSEWALSDPNALGFLRPILAENDGVMLFITTPRGANHAKKTFDLAKQDPDNWFCELLTADDTGVFGEDKLAAELRELQHDYGEDEGRALFQQEYHCSWETALHGSYYGPYLARATAEGRIGRVPIDRSISVCTGWDLGMSDSTAIWFIQVAGREFRLIDYHEAAGVGLDEYARVLEEKARAHKWIYDRHFFPHDVAVRELSNRGRSRVDTLRSLGVRPIVVPQHNVNDGVNAVRKLLDCAYIDENRCERGLNALRTFPSGYRDPRERPKPLRSLMPESSGGSDGVGWMGI